MKSLIKQEKNYGIGGKVKVAQPKTKHQQFRNRNSQNAGLDVNGDGKVGKSEIKTKVQVYITEGLNNKETEFECGKDEQKPNSSEVSKCPEDCSQCLDYADVWDNPQISTDNGDKNNNRYGYNSARGHKGIDILSGPSYKDVHSIMCGEVVSIS